MKYDYNEYRKAEKLEEKREENIIATFIIVVFTIVIIGFYKAITL